MSRVVLPSASLWSLRFAWHKNYRYFSSVFQLKISWDFFWNVFTCIVCKHLYGEPSIIDVLDVRIDPYSDDVSCNKEKKQKKIFRFKKPPCFKSNTLHHMEITAIVPSFNFSLRRFLMYKAQNQSFFKYCISDSLL